MSVPRRWKRWAGWVDDEPRTIFKSRAEASVAYIDIRPVLVTETPRPPARRKRK